MKRNLLKITVLFAVLLSVVIWDVRRSNYSWFFIDNTGVKKSGFFVSAESLRTRFAEIYPSKIFFVESPHSPHVFEYEGKLYCLIAIKSEPCIAEYRPPDWLTGENEKIIPAGIPDFTALDVFKKGAAVKVGKFSEGLAPVLSNPHSVVKTGWKSGYIDESGVRTLTLDYEWCAEFNDGLAQVQKNGKYGYIDRTGKEVIPCIYDDASAFSDGYASVKKERSILMPLLRKLQERFEKNYCGSCGGEIGGSHTDSSAESDNAFNFGEISDSENNEKN